MKNFLLAIVILLGLNIATAQTHSLQRSAFEGGMSLSVEFTDLTGADQDTTTFQETTSANTVNWAALFIPMDSTRALSTDTFTVYLKGFATTLAPGIRIDSFTVIGRTTYLSNTNVAGVQFAVTPGWDFPYWGLEVVQANAGTATKTKNRLYALLYSKGFNTGFNVQNWVDKILHPTTR